MRKFSVTLTSSKVQYTFQNEENGNKRLPINNFDELLYLVNCTTENNTNNTKPITQKNCRAQR